MMYKGWPQYAEAQSSAVVLCMPHADKPADGEAATQPEATATSESTGRKDAIAGAAIRSLVGTEYHNCFLRLYPKLNLNKCED
eukprot:4433864-Amphidinium_carterae.2